MAPANEITVMHLRKDKKNTAALKKYARLGRLFVRVEGKSDDYYIDRFIDYLNEITFILKLPKLGALGVNESDLSEICQKTEIKNNPAKLSQGELEEILRRRL
jgi:alcohol dehydrogenase class IV